MQKAEHADSRKVLIAYFSWSGNTRSIAKEIQRLTNGDLFEIVCETPYSSDYSTVLKEARRDLENQARPKLAARVKNMEQYDTVILGYPLWWGTIPMPVASFLEEYDLAGYGIHKFVNEQTEKRENF